LSNQIAQFQAAIKNRVKLQGYQAQAQDSRFQPRDGPEASGNWIFGKRLKVPSGDVWRSHASAVVAYFRDGAESV
jgi:hypothetical protein